MVTITIPISARGSMNSIQIDSGGWSGWIGI